MLHLKRSNCQRKRYDGKKSPLLHTAATALRRLIFPVMAVAVIMGGYRMLFFFTGNLPAVQTIPPKPINAPQNSAENTGDPFVSEVAEMVAAEAAPQITQTPELDLLARYLTCVTKKTGGSLGVLAAIGNVMCNRVASDQYPDTLYDVLYQDYTARYGTDCDLLLYGDTDPVALRAAANAMASGGGLMDGALQWEYDTAPNNGKYSMILGNFCFS